MFSLLEDVADLPPLRMKASPRHDRVILRHLMDRSGWLSTREIEDLVWGDEEDGGPLETGVSIAVVIHHIRSSLKPGFEIESQMGRGSRGYRLVADEAVILERIAQAIAA